MKISLTVDKTDYININGQPTKVSTLPQELRYEIETLDRIKQDQVNAAYQYEVCELAIKAKQAFIKALVDKMAEVKEPEPSEQTQDK